MPDKKTDTNQDKVTQLALQWVEANAEKNAAIKVERNTATLLKKEVASGTKVVDLNDREELQIGFLTSNSEEIDPKLLFEKHPDIFWQICSVAKGTVVDLLGEKEAAKLSRTVTKNDFKVKKVRK